MRTGWYGSFGRVNPALVVDVVAILPAGVADAKERRNGWGKGRRQTEVDEVVEMKWMTKRNRDGGLR